MNTNQLIAALTSSAELHDENTGEDHGDLPRVLRIALEHLESLGQLPDFIERLAKTDLPEFWEYEWLRPQNSYVRVQNSAETLQLFMECRDRGFQLAAATIQNSGPIPLDDFQAGLESITVPDLKRRYDSYITAHLVLGKDADE
jgi:hypothetical protein